VERTQKTYFDKHVKGPMFAVDQHVWFHWPRPLVRQRNKKLPCALTNSSVELRR